jgi:hypothetical protein
MDTTTRRERLGDWYPTYSGKKFWPLDPRVEDIDIRDIAHSLSLINRFNGHTKYARGYSVAQHSVLGSKLIVPDLAMEFLLHDGTECYYGDVISPVKAILGKAYSDLEDKLADVIADKYKLATNEAALAEVKEVDQRMATTEIRDLCRYRPWRSQPNPPYPFKIKPWSPAKSEKEFILRYCELVQR